MKALNLSSPSVAYRHLQKLDDLGYLQKNDYGEYIAKNKAHIKRLLLDWSSLNTSDVALLHSFF